MRTTSRITRLLQSILTRKPRTIRRRQTLDFLSLENRIVPAWTVSLSGNTCSFIGDGSDDSLTLSVDSGKLTHNLSGQGGLFNQYDLNPNVAGEQSLLVNAITSLTVNGNGGYDYITLYDVPAPASITDVENFTWRATDPS